ncbi:hypothetical protein HPB48_021832 [Haemaphysalis longicornis]|uniref:Uncharacterized protein n=1 Tax=Haemaphysalis longicornis TaxID=44386 RepID=A0A9J6G248_HAELO|nr:hypothetical protein HPB48_021832 [Haemaphysalis longicornis]
MHCKHLQCYRRTRYSALVRFLLAIARFVIAASYLLTKQTFFNEITIRRKCQTTLRHQSQANVGDEARFDEDDIVAQHRPEPLTMDHYREAHLRRCRQVLFGLGIQDQVQACVRRA